MHLGSFSKIHVIFLQHSARRVRGMWASEFLPFPVYISARLLICCSDYNIGSPIKQAAL